MNILASRRTPPPAGNADPLVSGYYGPGGLLEMIAQCDYVVVTAPLTAQTHGMIGAREFAAMLTTETERWRKVVELSGQKKE